MPIFDYTPEVINNDDNCILANCISFRNLCSASRSTLSKSSNGRLYRKILIAFGLRQTAPAFMLSLRLTSKLLTSVNNWSTFSFSSDTDLSFPSGIDGVGFLLIVSASSSIRMSSSSINLSFCGSSMLWPELDSPAFALHWKLANII